MTTSRPFFSTRHMTASPQALLLLIVTMALAIGVLVSSMLAGVFAEAITSLDIVANGTWTA